MHRLLFARILQKVVGFRPETVTRLVEASGINDAANQTTFLEQRAYGF